MRNLKIKTGIHGFASWIHILLFLILTNAFAYLTSLLDFSESDQLIFVFSIYLLAYIVSSNLLLLAWQILCKLLAAKSFPDQKILATYELTFEEYEKIKVFLAETRT